jgi:hypothetical protein
LGVLCKVIVDDQTVHGIVSEVLTNGRTGKRSEILHRVRVRSGRNDDYCVLQRAVLSKGFNNTGNLGHFLSNGDVHAVHRRAARGMGGLLVDHRVNGFDSGLEWFLYWLSFDNTRSENFDESEFIGWDWTKTVKRLAKRVHDTTKKTLTHWDLDNLSGFADLVPFLDLGFIADENSTDGIFFKVKGKSHDAVWELKEFSHLAVWESVDARNSVSNLENGSNVVYFYSALELL